MGVTTDPASSSLNMFSNDSTNFTDLLLESLGSRHLRKLLKAWLICS